MGTIYGNNASSYWRTRVDYSTVIHDTYVSITASVGVYWSKKMHKDHTYYSGRDTPIYLACSGQTTSYFTNRTDHSSAAVGTIWWYGSRTFNVNRGTSNSAVTLTGYVKHASGWSGYEGGSTASGAISIPARAYYTIAFNANATDVTGMPSNVGKYNSINITLPSTKPARDGWSFKYWCTNADDIGGTRYSAGQTYTANGNVTLYAIWGAVDAPTCDTSELTFSVPTEANPPSVIRGFTDVSCDVAVTHVHELRDVTSIQMGIGSVVSNSLTADGTLTIDGADFTVADEGEQTVFLRTTDSAGALGEYEIGTVNVIAPTWSKDVVFDVGDFPDVSPSGMPIVDGVYIYNYATEQEEKIPATKLEFIDYGSQWGFNYVFDEDHVSKGLNGELIVNPNINVRVEYKYYSAQYSVSRRAFFETTRNQNYSNGIYNVMFVSGIENPEFTDYSSRVWWCATNDPLYFPDLNYIEVGSNDTSIQGLTKVGDYLGVVKQSKTTDTAIFLVYPTSFEEDTTYAVKQGVQGVGALARYSFNILGDETLFLSPNGVMAIVPSEDNEHKVQNRSYYVDKKLLAESEIQNAYSFVYDGKYFLAIGNGVGAVYVLDGNQRNSWGNDRTNLVYECYYLENVPANCFMKYDDHLLFSTSTEVCEFKDSFTDAYDNLTGEENVPVKAEWSTIFDDDGSLHYYKTMQKKGNLVSVLPLDKQIYFTQVAIDEETFNANKKNYWTQNEDGTYTQCTEESVFDAETNYFIQHRSATKVLVRKDDKDPVEIQRTFGVSSNIPSELFLNKKFKKYKRLQFILKNEEAEDFGVDEIVKNYTLQNYAKR